MTSARVQESAPERGRTVSEPARPIHNGPCDQIHSPFHGEALQRRAIDEADDAAGGGDPAAAL